jgi:hypothetical protein
MVESTFPSTKASLKRKAIIMLSISTMTTMSSASIFMVQDAEASRVGLRVLVHGGEGNVCVESSNENAGCEFADGGTLEFEFSPDAVEVGDTFSVCDSNGCETGRNGEEKAPEHVYLGGGGGGRNNGGGSGGSSTDGDRGDGRSIVGTYADGYEAGKREGQQDWNSRNPHNSKCPPNDSLSWCAGFKVGYEAGGFG